MRLQDKQSQSGSSNFVDNFRKNLLNETPKGRRAENRFTRSLDAKAYAKIGSGHKPALVVVGKSRRGAQSAKELAQYMTREGEKVQTRDVPDPQPASRALHEMEQWSKEFRERRHGRDVYHIMVSSPPGTKREPFEQAVQDFSNDAFKGHQWMYAVHEPDLKAHHESSKHLHAHIAFAARGDDGYKYRAEPGWKQRFREIWAEKACEQGILVEASLKWQRGDASRTISKSVLRMRERGVETEFDRRVAEKARDSVDVPETEHEQRLRETSERDNTKALHLAREFSYQAQDPKLSSVEREDAQWMAASIRAYVQNTPEPKTDRQRAQEQERQQER